MSNDDQDTACKESKIKAFTTKLHVPDYSQAAGNQNGSIYGIVANLV